MKQTIKPVNLTSQKIQNEYLGNNGADDALNVAVTICDEKIRVFTDLKMCVTAENILSEPLEMVPKLSGYSIIIDGKEVDYRHTFINDPNKFESAAPKTRYEDIWEFSPDFMKLYDGKDTSKHKVELVVYYDLKNTRFRNSFQMEEFEIEIDYRSVQKLLTLEGEDSNYVKFGDKIFYVSPYTRAYDNRYKKTAIDINSHQVLNRQYIKDKNRVLRDGITLKGVNPSGFKVFNRLFSGNQEIVLTSYGKAKVEDPVSFEVLDDGNQFVFREINRHGYGDGYGAGYARDKSHVYFFCESTNTPHAIKVRAAKTPATFQSVGHAYGVDDKKVFLEGIVIKEADPQTWVRLRNGFSKDKSHAYYYGSIIQNADVDTFEVLEPGTYTGLDVYAKDKNNYYERTQVCNPPKLT